MDFLQRAVRATTSSGVVVPRPTASHGGAGSELVRLNHGTSERYMGSGIWPLLVKTGAREYGAINRGGAVFPARYRRGRSPRGHRATEGGGQRQDVGCLSLARVKLPVDIYTGVTMF